MGNSYFGLHKRPFIAEPIPDGYCPFGSSERARVLVSRCVERQEGVALVSGFSGTGKTLLCRTLLQQFQDAFPTVLLNGENLSDVASFFETLLVRLEIPFDSRTIPTMRDVLLSQLETPRFHAGVLLLIDDAQATALRVFEELRQLLDVTSALGRGVRIVLVGDMSLEEKLTFEQLQSFSKRITARAFLEKFNRDDTVDFLRMELERAGDSKGIFSNDVCREIHRFAEGVPRLTNQLADNLLIMGLELDAEKATQSVETWDAEPLPIDVDDSGVFDSDDLETSSGIKPEIKTEIENCTEIVPTTSLFQITFTPEMVRKAWHKMQQLPEDVEDAPATGMSLAEKIAMQKTGSKYKENVIEFGSLDDDFGNDSSHSVDLSPTFSSPEDATGMWAYDEIQDVRDAVEELNAIPEEWETPTPDKLPDKLPDKMPDKQAERTTPASENSVKVEANPHKEMPEDLFDVFHDEPNIHFPSTNENFGQSPHYTALNIGTPLPFQTVASINSASSLSSSPSSPSSSVRRTTHQETSGFQEPSRERKMTVDDIINDAIMEDTVHSMKLLQKILNALREESLQNVRVPHPAEYWLNLQCTVKDSMQAIATMRTNQAEAEELRKDAELQQRVRATLASKNVPLPQGNTWNGVATQATGLTSGTVPTSPRVAPSVSSVSKRTDYYQPETLLEEGGECYTPAGKSVMKRYVPECTTPEIPETTCNTGAFATALQDVATEGHPDVALLRSLLQDENVRNSINQDKLSQIIAQLRMMSQQS